MKGLQTSIATIKKAGFSHIKVELEANLNRGGTHNDQEECGACKGRCVVDTLDGHGRKSGIEECTACGGIGVIGDSRTYDFYQDEDCQAFIMKYVSKEANKAINFKRFYRDGSVDSELTFTLPIDNPEYIIEVINAWNKFVQVNGNGQDVQGAGMHICVLQSSIYPPRKHLKEPNLSNFKSEVTKLLPALYVAGTSGNFTRGLRFRGAFISPQKRPYPAIHTVSDTCLEYRLFETCYERPETIYEYIGVIARTLEYYIDPSKKVISLGKEFPIYDKHHLSGFIGSAEQVEILKKQFRHVRPAGMTDKEFLGKREIELKVTKLREAERDKLKKIKVAYAERVKSYKQEKEKPLDEYEQDNVEYWKRERPGMDEDWYFARVRSLTPLETEQTYLRNNLRKEQPAVVLNV